VWLTRSKVDNSPVPGILELMDGRLRLTLDGRPPKKTARWLDERVGVPGTGERLRNGGAAVVLEVPREQVDAKFPNPLVTPGVYLTANGEEWLVWFMSPTKVNALTIFMRAAPGYVAKKRWRQALGG